MPPLQPILLTGQLQGLQTDVKPFLLPDQAFTEMYNCYVWRGRVLKKQGLKFLGRLRRKLTAEVLVGGITSPGVGNTSVSIFSLLGLSTDEPNAELQPGTAADPLVIVVGAQTLTDNTGDGKLAVTGVGLITDAMVSYATGTLTMAFSGAAGPLVSTITTYYFPGLPVIGDIVRERDAVNNEDSIFFDTKYSYIYQTTGFEQYGAGTTWNGSAADLFLGANYRGSNSADKLLFVTNGYFDTLTGNDPIRHTAGSTWTDFTPTVSSTETLWQANIIVPYYGRLVCLNTWEGTAAGTAKNYYNRCRASQVGDPTDALAFDSTIPGRGIFIDAPTDQRIMSAQFFKNTLIVFFERSTWQLRYVGDYGLPFIWERISSDFGAEAKNSSVLFDNGVLAVGDKAIVSSNAINVTRIDDKNPDLVFSISNTDRDNERVFGVRDFQKELVYWSYTDYNLIDTAMSGTKFPNMVMVYNYRNDTWAKFRDNITTFGSLQSITGVTWDSETSTWDDDSLTWDDVDAQSQFVAIVAGNQQGYIHSYGYTSVPNPSMPIKAIDISATPITFTVQNHNLYYGDYLYSTGIAYLNSSFATVATNLNEQFYKVSNIVDENTFEANVWDGTQYISDFSATPTSSDTYIGNGQFALLTNIKVTTKDFNPFIAEGGQCKLSYVDFLTDADADSEVTVNVFTNSATNIQSNLSVGNSKVEQSLTSPFYTSTGAEYAWHRFFATCSGQFFRIQLTYDDALMSSLPNQNSSFVLNAIQLYVRRGSRNVLQ